MFLCLQVERPSFSIENLRRYTPDSKMDSLSTKGLSNLSVSLSQSLAWFGHARPCKSVQSCTEWLSLFHRLSKSVPRTMKLFLWLVVARHFTKTSYKIHL